MALRLHSVVRDLGRARAFSALVILTLAFVGRAVAQAQVLQPLFELPAPTGKSPATALFEDLASHGWALLHVVHPYEAASTLSDGTFVTFTDEKNALRPGIRAVLNEWGPESATMDKVVAATDDKEKEQLLRGYLTTLKNTDQVVKRGCST